MKTQDPLSTRTYKLTEQHLFDLLRNSFVAGENFAEDLQDFEMEEVEEFGITI